MAGPGTGHPDLVIPVPLVWRHLLLPVFPVFVLDTEGDRRADGLAPPHTGEDFSPVLFDLHAAAAAVSTLAAGQINIDLFFINDQAGRQAVDYGRKLGAVGFTGSEIAQHCSSFSLNKCQEYPGICSYRNEYLK